MRVRRGKRRKRQLKRNRRWSLRKLRPRFRRFLNRWDMGRFWRNWEKLNLRVIPEEFFARVDIPVLDTAGSGLLTDEAIELFALGEEEVSRVNESLDTTRDRLNAAEMKGLKIVNVSDSEVAFEIPALGDLADEVEEGLRQEIRTALGERDGETLLDLMDHRRGDYWNDFGREERRITYTAEPREEGDIKITIKREVRTADSVDFHHRNMISTVVPPDGSRGGIHSDGERQDYLLDLLPESMSVLFQ